MRHSGRNRFWISLPLLTIAAGCSNNVVAPESGGGGAGGETSAGAGGESAGAGLGGPAGDAGTGGAGLGDGDCPEEIWSATASAPRQLGFESTPPIDGSYVVAEVLTDALTLVNDAGEEWIYRWAGPPLETAFLPGDEVMVQAAGGPGTFQIIVGSSQQFVATYEHEDDDFPALKEDVPFGGPQIDFSIDCVFSTASCTGASRILATDGEVVMSIPTGQTAALNGFQVTNSRVTTILCDLVMSHVAVTVMGPS